MFKSSYTSKSGIDLPFKINCQSLTDQEWEILAELIGNRIDFNEVYGASSGGLPLALRLVPFISPQMKKKRRILLVDDVLTTGATMESQRSLRQSHDVKVKGVVVFARSRSHLPDWISPIFLLHGEFADDF